jgi:hypothetical protein
MCAAYEDCLLGVFLLFLYIILYIIFKFTNLILKYKKYRKTNNRGDWWWMDVTLEMLLGLDGDLYNYDDITDNLWPFKTRNKGKENKYVQFSMYNIQLSCLRKYFQELPAYSDDETVRRYNFYYN